MDVRCDLCQTEYELDDDSVGASGASVQCTTCGHTFVVGKNGVRISAQQATSSSNGGGGGPGPGPGPAGAGPGPQAADWLLATEDGQTHRFRDLTTLQKWVVERKVTREDRVSQKGGRWRSLGEVTELEPFFDVVAQADRARATELARRSAGREPAVPGSSSGSTSSGSTPTRQTALSRQAAARMGGSNGGGAAANSNAGAHMGRHGGGAADSTARPTVRHDSARARVLLGSSADQDIAAEDDELEPASFMNGHRRLKIGGGIAIVVLAVIAAYIGFQRPYWFFGKATEPPRVAQLPAPPAVAAPPVAPSPPPAPAPPAATPSRPIIEAMPGPPPSRPAPPERGAAGDPTAAPVKAKSYERLVADADRLLENGQNARAQKLIDEALALKPEGVEAISTSAYLLLDREKQLAAIAAFKRALGLVPGYGPALFGLAEAYRAQGDSGKAAESYRKYLDVSPGGGDASAARRQLKDLEAAAPKRAPARDDEPPAGGAKLEERGAPSLPDQPAP